MARDRDTALALFLVALGLFVVFVWVPLDVDTGLVEVRRRRARIGDALAPTVAGAALILSGLLLWLETRRSHGGDAPHPTLANLGFVVGLTLLFAGAFAVMRWTGPAAVALFADGDASYRALRDSAPWKFLGYVAGGTLIVGALISYARGRISPDAFALGLCAAAALAALYDLPFEDLLLPPNGDF